MHVYLQFNSSTVESVAENNANNAKWCQRVESPAMRSHNTKAPRILLYYSIISFWKDLIELLFSYTKGFEQHTRIIVVMSVNIVPMSFIESFYPRRAAIKVQAEGRPEQSAAEN